MATVRYFRSGGGSGDGGDEGTGDARRARPKPTARENAPGSAGAKPLAAPPLLHARKESPRDLARTRTTELPAIPDKIYFRIGEVAHLVGVEPHVLRYWEQEFRSIRPTKSQRGQRVYSRRDVDHLRKIRTLLYENGFTIAGAKRVLRTKGLEPRDEADPAVRMSGKIKDALLDIRKEVELLLRDFGG